MKRGLMSLSGLCPSTSQLDSPSKRHKIDNRKIRRKEVLLFLQRLKLHIFALPFVRIGGTLIDQETLDDVYENVEKNIYSNITAFRDAVLRVLDRKSQDGVLEISERKILYKSGNMRVMKEFLMKEIETFYAEECSVSDEESLEKLIGMDHVVILKTLKTRYCHVPIVPLLSKALELSVGFDVDPEKIQDELEKLSDECSSLGTSGLEIKPQYRSYYFYPTQELELSKEKKQHFYIAGYQFYTKVSSHTSAPLQLRRVKNIQESIKSITYIENDESNRKFNEQKNLFQRTGKATEILLFHGTSEFSLNKILSENFNLDSEPREGTWSVQRKKKMKYGRGIYFSALPGLSLMYGDELLLCRVMLGHCEAVSLVSQGSAEISPGYDSREVRFGDEGLIHVVRSPAQILPYCVIKLKQGSLSRLEAKQFGGFGSNLISFWTVVSTPDLFERRAVAERTVRELSRPSIFLQDKAELCTVCRNTLATGESVHLDQCGHSFHLACLVGLVEHLEGQLHVQCPNCQAVHGVKTGNMPTTGKMMYSRHGFSLPGHPNYGVIIVKYDFDSGVQDETHPKPGHPFHAKGFPRMAFLPGDSKGERVLEMLIKAFQRRLTFTIGRSLSWGLDDCVIWNGIHHKTVAWDNMNGHGYPDMDYLDRVIQELASNGISA